MTSRTQHRGAGRPHSSLLTPAKITQAAQKLLAQDGNFTMSKLAQTLGVAPSSLYNHVASRDQVLAAISDQVVQNIDVGPLREASKLAKEGQLSPMKKRNLWVEATEHWALSYRQAFSLAPSIVNILALTPIRQAPATLRMYEDVTAAFTAFGFSPRQALLTIEALEAFLLGAATDLQAPADIFNPGSYAAEAPTLQAGYESLGDSPQDDAFLLGLSALLTGFSLTLP